jgi:hypothetical protein
MADPQREPAMPRLRILSKFAVPLLLLAACDQPTTISTQPRQLREAPTQVLVEGHSLIMETYVGRDFMPIAPPDGQPMVAVLRIRTADGRAFPSGVTAERVSVVQGEAVWTAPTVREAASQEPGTLEVIAREGPKWQPGSKVDVVVYLRDSASREHLLRAPDQTIQRSD